MSLASTPRYVRASLSALAIAATVALAGAAWAQDEAPVYAGQDPSLTQSKAEMLMASARKRLAAAKQQLFQRSGKTPRPGARARVWTDVDQIMDGASATARQPESFGAQGTLVTPTNTLANNKASDAAGAGQAEQSLAFLGDLGMVAWNDGQGFNTSGDVQGGAYTVNGGATWVDYGSPPHLAGWPVQAWTSDPVIALNEKTGVFYYCGLLYPSSTTNGVGVVSATFPGGVFTWGTPVVPRSASNATDFIDKQWLVADSLTGNLYLTYTRFFSGGNEIQFQRSTDGGLTWSTPMVLSSPAASGYVQGSRPAVGPSGELYVSWYEIGTGSQDYVMVRKSVDGGASFAAEVMGTAFFNNFGTGAPGFNRNRSVTEPCPVVDRSTGAYRGRLYLTWQESIDWYNDPLGGGGSKNEVESNNTSAGATPFTPGQRLRGAFSSTADQDWFSFAATQGTTYIFWVDSIPRPLYTLRLFCTNGSSPLAYAGDASAPAGGNSYMVWTAPTTGTYYIRMFYLSGGTGIGGYRIQTGTNSVPTPGLERSRDARDVFVNHSDDGTTFSVPTRTNDNPGWFDDWLPEVAVACDGRPVSMWYDFRDITTTCGSTSHIYTTRSDDGGATWVPNQVVSTAPTVWGTTSSNIAPNQGDYNGLYGGDALGYAWADGRLGDADVYTARNRVGFSVFCGNDTTLIAGAGLDLSLPLANLNGMFGGETAHYSFTADRAWPGLPASGSVPVGELAGAIASLGITIPDTAATGPVRICFTVTCDGGACARTCCLTVNVINIATPTLASLVSAQAEPGTVRVRWNVSVSTPVAVYRSTGAAWDRLAMRLPDGDGFIELEDTGVAAGTRYGYRLGVTKDGREVTAGETWVTVPAGAQFALHGGRPNPTTGPLTISFSLADAAPATLELIDLNGRRVFERAVGSLGAGYHVVPVDGGSRLAPGIYLVRLTQRANVLTSKVSVVR